MNGLSLVLRGITFGPVIVTDGLGGFGAVVLPSSFTVIPQDYSSSYTVTTQDR